MSTTVYVPRDAAALAAGADALAAAIERLADVKVVRNGSRGLLWLEPLVEVQTPAGRIAYGPVTLDDLPSLVSAGFLQGNAHALRLGAVEELAQFKRQRNADNTGARDDDVRRVHFSILDSDSKKQSRRVVNERLSPH